MSEIDLQSLVIKEFIKRGAHVSNIESGLTCAGFPDLDVCREGKINQLEIKHFKKTKPSHRDMPDIRDTQVKWFRDRIKAGGNPMILTQGREGLYMLHHGKYVHHFVSMKGTNELISLPCVIWQGEIDFDGLLEELLS